jgi:hypothetical protein
VPLIIRSFSQVMKSLSCGSFGLIGHGPCYFIGLGLYIVLLTAYVCEGQDGRKDDKYPVSISFLIKEHTRTKTVAEITLNCDSGWSVYGNPVGAKDMEALETTVSCTCDRKPAKATTKYPRGRVVHFDNGVGDIRFFEDNALILVELDSDMNSGELEIDLSVLPFNISELRCSFPARTFNLKVGPALKK